MGAGPDDPTDRFDPADLPLLDFDPDPFAYVDPGRHRGRAELPGHAGAKKTSRTCADHDGIKRSHGPSASGAD